MAFKKSAGVIMTPPVVLLKQWPWVQSLCTALLCIFLFQGCVHHYHRGYGGATAPLVQALRVKPVVNRTSGRSLQPLVSENLRQQLLIQGLQIDESASMTLSLTLTHYEYQSLAMDPRDSLRPAALQARVEAEIILEDAQGIRYLDRHPVSAQLLLIEGEQGFSQSEAQNADALAKELSRTVVRQLSLLRRPRSAP